MKVSTIRNVAGLFTGVLLATTSFSPLARASATPIPAPEFLPLAKDVPLTKAGGPQVVIHEVLGLRAGESRRVFGRVEATSSNAVGSYFEVYTRCIGPDGRESIHGVVGENHTGNDTGFPTYVIPGHLVLYPSLLFQASTAGAYDCQLVAWAGDDGVTLTAIARDSSGFSTTWLQVSSADDEGAGWWQDPPCDSEGSLATCTYLGGGSHQTESYLFYNDGSAVNLWLAGSNAAFVDASATVELTTCDHGTKSCTSGNIGNSDGTVVTAHLELIQLNSNLGVCKVNQGVDVTDNVANGPHHHPMYFSLIDVPVYPECGSRQFMLRVLMKYVSGNPIKIDGTRPGESYTHAWAINSVYGTALAVPNLIGDAEIAAESAIRGAGYVVSNIFSTLSTAPAGTVISQNPSAGLIELPGSPVEFTVSTGGVIVPNVLSLPQSDATSAISARGLVPTVSSSKKCINLGDVLTQNPSAGVLVAPGSTVHITVDSGTPRTCQDIQ